MIYRQLSPDERYMLARLRRQGLNQSEIARCMGRHRSTLCRHVWRDKREGGALYTHLRGSCKRRRKRYGAYDSRGRLAGKRMISQRPPEVEARVSVGHWEADTVAGAGSKDCVLTLVERKTGLVLIGKLSDRTARGLSLRLTRLIRG